MISVRLSEEEYTGFKRLCLVRGARSVSDLARLAVSSMLVNEDRAVVPRVEAIRLEVAALNRKVDEISATLSSIRSNA
ncbi:MAG TPA: hypothetical protein VFA04_11945 [Bryobacteraceae bacterium]|nr:hypothetical protein [Bryobacteraceae bacterium]